MDRCENKDKKKKNDGDEEDSDDEAMEDVEPVNVIPDVDKITDEDGGTNNLKNKYFKDNKHQQQKINKNDEKTDEEIAEEACAKFFVP